MGRGRLDGERAVALQIELARRAWARTCCCARLLETYCSTVAFTSSLSNVGCGSVTRVHGNVN